MGTVTTPSDSTVSWVTAQDRKFDQDYFDFGGTPTMSSSNTVPPAESSLSLSTFVDNLDLLISYYETPSHIPLGFSERLKRALVNFEDAG